jgi:hypothetical protein
MRSRFERSQVQGDEAHLVALNLAARHTDWFQLDLR